MSSVRLCLLARGLGKILVRVAMGIGLVCGLGAAWPAGSCAQSLPPPSDSARAPGTDSLRGRRDALRAARARNAERLHPPERASLEDFFLWVEENQLLTQLVSARGRKVRLLPGGLGRGSGVALRLAFVPFPQRPDLDVRFSAGGSVLGYWRFAGSVGYRYDSWFGYAYSQVHQRPERTYLAFQNTSGPNESLTVDVTSWASGGVLGVRPLPPLSIAASAAYLRNTSGATASETKPVDPGILNPATSTRYVSVGGHFTLDLRDVRYERDFGTRYVPSADDLTDRPLNPDSGTLVSLDYTRFHGLSDPDAGFDQAEVEVQQYVSVLNGYHTLALRHRSVFTDLDDNAVPFYQLPYVGGNFTLRGYDEFRFRGGTHALLYNLEYRYKVWHHMDVALFGDAGKVFDAIDQWGVADLRYSYGAELRFITPRTTLLRFGVAFDENHAAQLVFEFSNIF